MRFRNEMRIYFNFVTVFILAAILSSLSLSVNAQTRGSRSVLRGSFESSKITAEPTKESVVACDSGKFDFAAGPGTVIGGSGFGNSRTYSNSGTTLTVRAFSRAADTGTWETAAVGQWNGAGIGVSNRDSNEGNDPNHKVDNVGNRKDYLLLEFSQPIVVPVAYLNSISTDSDMRVWFGNGGSLVSLSDATLASFTQAANGGNAASSSRTANLSASAVSANKFVIAAETIGTDLDDYFKVEAIDFTCPTTPPNLIVIKEVLTIDQTNASTQGFGFTATNTNQGSFSLVDNNVVGPDRVSLTVNTGATATVTEGVTPAWTLSDLSCTGTAAGNININLSTRSVSVTPQASETVTCTFRNVLLRASAASATISGRATLMNSRGVSGAVITLQNLGTGETKTVITNSFGYYTLADVEVGNFYMVTIAHRRYRFAESSKFVDLTDNVAGFDFTGGF